MKKIAIFASGSGSNAENIVNHFNVINNVEVSMVLTNNKNAFVLERAKKMNVKSLVFSKTDFVETDRVLEVLKENDIDWIILAGFLLKVPSNLIDTFPKEIINIHPALLPKFGGKGMYGDRVHQAVIEAKERESGITIHYVNENYDEGKTIFQAKCLIEKGDTAQDLAKKIHELEYRYFPEVIEKVINQ